MVADRVTFILSILYSRKGGTAVYIVQYINKTRRTSITGLQYGLQYGTVYGTAQAALSKVPYTSPKFFWWQEGRKKKLKNTQQLKDWVKSR